VTVLAIDTTARRRVVVAAATKTGALLDAEVASGLVALPALRQALSRLLGPDCEAVVVATGPGSYTGLRAGMAAALGVAHSLGLPLHGVPSLEVVANAATGDHPEVMAVADAGRGGVYVGRFRQAAGGLEAVAPVRRMTLASLIPGGEAVVVSIDALGFPGLEGGGDPALALAMAVPGALSRPALALAGLTAAYVDDVASPPGGPRVSSV
jgi:tRNA threonylcarbamoyl adenosine modification protein YeaZ